MLRHAIPLAATALLAAPASAAEITIAVSGPVVELSITEEVRSAPDMATIGAGVTSEAPTAVEAMRLNARAMDSLIRQITALGVAQADIQTSGINLSPRYDYDRTSERQVFRGYQVSNRVSVTMRDLAGLGPALDALVAAGATDLSGPAFGMQDDAGAKAQARRAAVERGQAQALDYAKLSGFADIRLLEISETVHSGSPQPMLRGVAMAEADAVSTPVQPGMVGTAVTLTVKYEMTR